MLSKLTRSLLLLIVLFAAVRVHAAEYLVDFRIDGKKIGSFILYEENGELYIEQRLFDTLKLPVTDGVNKLSYFEKYGKIDFDRARQEVRFTPSNPLLFAERRNTGEHVEKEIKPSSKFDLKSVDYSLFYNASGDYSFSGTVTGKLFSFDADYRFQLNGKSFFNLQWHDETNRYVRDVQIGRLSLYNLDGISISNELYSRYSGSFGTEVLTVYYPQGTRIDLFNGSKYIATYTVDAQPYNIPVELFYGINDLRLIVYTPWGEIREESIKKTVDSYLIPQKNFNYYLAAGKNSLDKLTGIARLSYGISNSLTTSVELNDDRFRAGGYFRVTPSALVSGFIENKGFELTGSYFDGFNAWAQYKVSDHNKSLKLSMAPRWRIVPVLTYSSDRGNINIDRGRLQLYAPVGRHFINPYVEIVKDSKTDTRVGFNSLFILPYRFRIGVDADTQKNLSTSLIKEINEGEITLKHAFKTDITELNLNIYRFKYLTLSARMSYDWQRKDFTATVGLTGSLTREGLSKDSQSSRATIYIRPFLDKNMNGIYDDGDEILEDIDAYVEGRKYKVNTVISDFIAYRPITAVVEDTVGYVADYHVARITPDRGSINYIDFPFYELVEIEGNTGKNGVEVLLVDIETGKVIRKTRTVMDGYYIFTVSKKMEKKVGVIW